MSRMKKALFVSATSILLISILIAISALAIHFAIKDIVNFEVDEALLAASNKGETSFYASNGFDMVEIGRLKGGGARKSRYELEDISEYIKNGFLAAEDREFYNHNGVNYKRTLGAFVNYVFKLGSVFGASTITQQVIKNISGDNDPTLKRKLAEIIRATHLEKLHKKDEILETYLNIVPMTDNMAGVGIASLTYFNKEPDEVTLEEAATIVGITNSPVKYNPYTHPDACIQKRNNVLYAMYDYGVISEIEYTKARNSPLVVSEKKSDTDNYDSWFIETVISDLKNDLSYQLKISAAAANMLIMNGSLTVYTTEMPALQSTLEKYFENTANFPTAVGAGLNYSMVISDSLTGDILATVGGVGKKNADRILNYASVPIRPASTLKPLALYAPLINEGAINWATVFDDVPQTFKQTENGYTVYPHNSPNVYDGLTTVRTAIEKSKNTVAVKLYEIAGAEKIYSNLKNNFGFDTLKRNVYDKNGNKLNDLGASSLALGQLTYGVSLRKLTNAYTVFPSEGVLHKSRSYTTVYDSEGKLLLENENEEKRIFKPECARVMNKLLQNVVDSGTARSITLKNIVDTAGKTGTSGNDRDRLFIGYTPYLTAGIWCGYSQGGKSVGKYTPTHLKIWDEIMTECHEIILKRDEYVKEFSVENLKYLPYCMDSGKLCTEACMYDVRGERIEYGYFYGDNIPSGECDKHILINVGEDGEEVKMSMLDIKREKFPAEIEIKDDKYIYSGDKAEESVFYDTDEISTVVENIQKQRKNKKIS